jgi:hypothetical protein
MLDKAILIATYVFLMPDGSIETMSALDKDFRAFEATACLRTEREENARLKELVEENKDAVDDKGRKLLAVTKQCYPVSRERFAIFSSTFMVPDE